MGLLLSFRVLVTGKGCLLDHSVGPRASRAVFPVSAVPRRVSDWGLSTSLFSLNFDFLFFSIS